MWFLVVVYVVASLCAYGYLFRELRAARRARHALDARLDAVTAPPLYTLSEGAPTAVVDDGALPLSSIGGEW